jgi:hypothetical protein
VRLGSQQRQHHNRERPNLLLNHPIKPVERLTGAITEDDLVSQRLQADLSLDLIPRDKRLASFYAGTSLAGGSGVSEVF